MTIAILSDILGNRPGLAAVPDDLRGRSCDALYCLGDLVGCGVSPNEVASGVLTFVGNYNDVVGHTLRPDTKPVGDVAAAPVPEAVAR